MSSVGHAEKDTSSLLKSVSRSLKAQGVSAVRCINDNIRVLWARSLYLISSALRPETYAKRSRARKPAAVNHRLLSYSWAYSLYMRHAEVYIYNHVAPRVCQRVQFILRVCGCDCVRYTIKAPLFPCVGARVVSCTGLTDRRECTSVLSVYSLYTCAFSLSAGFTFACNESLCKSRLLSMTVVLGDLASLFHVAVNVCARRFCFCVRCFLNDTAFFFFVWAFESIIIVCE